MSAKMTISMIFLLCLVIFQTIQLNEVQSFRFPIHNVTSCPRNDIEWRKASDRLNCSLHFNKKVFRYHCLPDSKLTTLVEFCYDQLRPLVEKGNCVVLDGFNTLLDNYNCSEFKDGCPDKHYDSDAISKYPSCLKINTKNRCFIAEKKCTPFSGLDITEKSTLTRSASQRKKDTEIDKLCQAAIVVSTLILTISAIGLFIYIKHRRKTLHFRCLRNGENEENDPLLGLGESDTFVGRRISHGHLGFKRTSDIYLRVFYGENVCMTSRVVEQNKQEINTEKKLNFIWKHKHGEEEYKIVNKDRDKEENRLKISNDPPIYTLTIERAKKDDEGEYKLVLMNENEEKQDVATFKLDVLECHRESEILVKRRIYQGHLGKSTSDEYLRVPYGENICMTSTVVEQNKQEGNVEKKLNFIWKHKNENKENRLTIFKYPPIYALTIERAKKEDEGEYKLVLMNEDEEKQDVEDVATFTLNVLGFKPLVKILGGALVYKGNTASFVVLQSSYPEAFRIKWYKVKMAIDLEDELTRDPIDISSDKYKGSTFDFLVINNASKDDQRRYVVEVENILGIGTHKIDLTVEEEEAIGNDKDGSQLKNDGKEIAKGENKTGRIKMNGEKGIISISNVRRVYHISNAGSGNFWISDGGRLMKIDGQGFLIHLEDVGRFNTGCHSVTSYGELLYLKDENVYKYNESKTTCMIDRPEQERKAWMAWCIHCSSNNDILVGLIEKKGIKGKIQRYNEKGEAQNCFGEKFLGKPLYITENKNTDVIVSDAGKRAVIAIDSNGDKRFKYDGNSATKFFPTGVCTDERSHILVCIYENNESNVRLLDEDGRFLKTLLAKEDCEGGPCAICIIDNNLYLGQESRQDIQVYKKISSDLNLHDID